MAIHVADVIAFNVSVFECLHLYDMYAFAFVFTFMPDSHISPMSAMSIVGDY